VKLSSCRIGHVCISTLPLAFPAHDHRLINYINKKPMAMATTMQGKVGV